MKIIRPSYNSHGKKMTATRWYLDFIDHKGIRHRWAMSADKQSTEAMGRMVDTLIGCRISGEAIPPDVSSHIKSLPALMRTNLVEAGILTKTWSAASRPMKELLSEFKQDLQGREVTNGYLNNVVSAVSKCFQSVGVKRIEDIEPVHIHRYLVKRRQSGAGIRTVNDDLAKLKCFINWLNTMGYLMGNPLAPLSKMNAKVDRRRRRRALTDEEMGRLLSATAIAQPHHSLTGEQRRLLYLLAMESGLRWKEIHSLRRTSFKLDLKPPTVTVMARYSKHRREDVLPLRSHLAEELRVYFRSYPGLDSEQAFKGMWRDKGVQMLRLDLEAAGIPFLTADGRCDFHSLRHTFITALSRAGVHPSLAMQLARHTDVRLTLEHYTHTALQEQADALETLPSLELGCAENSLPKQSQPQELSPSERQEKAGA